MAEESEDWVSAATALALLRPVMTSGLASVTIVARANDSMIRSRAARFIRNKHAKDDVEVPAEFWWARGSTALEQNWKTGDFSTWLSQSEYWRAYDVRFLRSDIVKMLLASPDYAAEKPNTESLNSLTSPGTKIFIGHGRSAAWRDLKDFVVERLKLPYDEFNAESAAGITNVDRLSEMLRNAAFAFLVFTAEDELADGGCKHG
jgi:hypothetical protein